MRMGRGLVDWKFQTAESALGHPIAETAAVPLSRLRGDFKNDPVSCSAAFKPRAAIWQQDDTNRKRRREGHHPDFFQSLFEHHRSAARAFAIVFPVPGTFAGLLARHAEMDKLGRAGSYCR